MSLTQRVETRPLFHAKETVKAIYRVRKVLKSRLKCLANQLSDIPDEEVCGLDWDSIVNQLKTLQETAMDLGVAASKIKSNFGPSVSWNEEESYL